MTCVGENAQTWQLSKAPKQLEDKQDKDHQSQPQENIKIAYMQFIFSYIVFFICVDDGALPLDFVNYEQFHD